jgi:hypothetical protein
MPAGTQPCANAPYPPDAEAAHQRALLHMLDALKLLDDAKQTYAAAHLQNAIDVLLKELPHSCLDDPSAGAL